MATSRYTGPKLEADNYYDWQNSALAYISARGVFSYIEHPEGLRPQVGTTQTPAVLAAAKAAAERAGGIPTTIVVPAPVPAGQPAAAAQAPGSTSTDTWFVAVPDPVTRVVESVTLAPKGCSPADLKLWGKEARVAVGVIWDTLGPSLQKDENAAYLMRSGDPFLLWAAIFRRVNPTTAPARYSAMNALMSLTWQDGWKLEDGHAAVTERFHKYLDHRSPGMTADEVLEEVALFAFISIVPEELDTFSSTVFITARDRAVRLQDLLATLQQEDGTQSIRGKTRLAEYRARIAREMAARAQPTQGGGAPGGMAKLTERQALAALQAAHPGWKKCWLCFGDHMLDACPFIPRVKVLAKELRENKNENRRPAQSANVAEAAAAGDDVFPETPNAAPRT